MLRMPWGYFVAVSLIAGAQPACASGEDIASRVDSIVEQMTLAEKIDLLGGERFFDVDGVPRLAYCPRTRTTSLELSKRAAR